MPRIDLMMRRSMWAAGLALALGAAACGSAATTKQGTSVVIKDPVKAIAATASATTRARTAKVIGQVTETGDGLPNGSVKIDMDGAIAFDGSAGEFKMNVGSFLPGVSEKLSIDVREVDGVMYMDFAPVLHALADQS